jgi:GntR family transcriptional regulator
MRERTDVSLPKSYARCHYDARRRVRLGGRGVRAEEDPMLMLTVLDGDLPLHERVAAAVRRAIADGAVGAGDALPTALQVADALGVHRNTVLRAYRALRDEGTIEMRAGRGARVRRAAAAGDLLHAEVAALLRAAAREGLDPDETADLVRAAAHRRRG